MNELAIVLQPSSQQHLYLQIYEHIVEEIKERKLLPGEKLPSIRFLAQYLQVSRSTVELSYEQLLAEGYVEAKPYRGYYVNQIDYLVGMNTQRVSKEEVEERVFEYTYDFSPTDVQKEGFPFSVWKKVQKVALAENELKLFALGNPQGEEALRSVIARYLHASRGVKCEKDQIIVGAGNDYLLMLLEKIIGNRQIVAIENPTYQRAYKIFQSFTYKVNAVEMDGSGMKTEALYESGATIAYVMPAHQFPTGIVMPIARRMELLTWANEEKERYIIEDDYDSEFRYRGRPVKALQSLDEHGKVIYMGTFSKSIAPAIRISYMVLPMSLVNQYKKNAYFYSSTVSRVDQATLEIFMRDGYFERHLNKMRKIYKEKHDVLLQALKPYGDWIQVTGNHMGLHLIIEYVGSKTQEQLLEEAEGVGVKLYPMKQYWVESPMLNSSRKQFLLGYASMELEKIPKGITKLMSTWEVS
ncbi:MAG: PLP-dependent aminotransferase family protein [Eubacteriales bacterium]